MTEVSTELYIVVTVPIEIPARNNEELNLLLDNIMKRYADRIQQIIPEAKIEVDTPFIDLEKD